MQYKDLRELSEAAIRLYLYLTESASQNPAFKMSIDVLADHARVAVADVVPAQAELVEAGLIETTKSRVTRVGDTECNLQYTKTKDKEFRTLLAEAEQLRAVVRELEEGDASGLADQLPPAQAAVVRAAEDIMGRALHYEEIWYLAQLVEAFKSTRVRDCLYSQKHAKSPLRATYAILKRGGRGKPYKKTEEEQVVYRKLGKDGTPWDTDKGEL